MSINTMMGKNVTAIKDASGNVVGLSAGGVIIDGTSTFAALPAANSVPAGTRRYVSDVGVGGSFWYSDGVRWRSVSRTLALSVVDPVFAGQLFGVGAAEALFGSTTLVKGGVLQPGDSLRWVSAWINPTIDSSIRFVRIRQSTTSGGVLTGNEALSIYTTSTAFNSINVDKVGTLTSNTNLRSGGNSIASGALTSVGQQSSTLASVGNDFYIGCTVTPGAGTSILMYSCAVIAEFAS